MGAVLGTQLPVLRVCQQIDTAESLALPTPKHTHKRHKIAEQSLSPSENQAQWEIKLMVGSLLTFQQTMLLQTMTAAQVQEEGRSGNTVR